MQQQLTNTKLKSQTKQYVKPIRMANSISGKYKQKFVEITMLILVDGDFKL